MKKRLILPLLLAWGCSNLGWAQGQPAPTNVGAAQVKKQVTACNSPAKSEGLRYRGKGLSLVSPYATSGLMKNEFTKRNLPHHYQTITIMGEGEATVAQATALLKFYNYKLPIEATPEQIVNMYYNEARLEGVKWDIAFAQALLETGFFRFGGTVVPEQNNFCGLGTTSATVRGAYFLIPELGVRAHIQHLLAYTRAKEPRTTIVDPRYALVHDRKLREGFTQYWSELNGKWAMGSEYCEKIIDIHEKMKQIITVSGEEEHKAIK